MRMTRRFAHEDANAFTTTLETQPASVRFVETEVKACPNAACRVAITRTSGCPHMICGGRREDGGSGGAGCGLHFCWTCGGRWAHHSMRECADRPPLPNIGTITSHEHVAGFSSMRTRLIPSVYRATRLATRAYRELQELRGQFDAAGRALQRVLSDANDHAAAAAVAAAMIQLTRSADVLGLVYTHELAWEEALHEAGYVAGGGGGGVAGGYGGAAGGFGGGYGGGDVAVGGGAAGGTPGAASVLTGFHGLESPAVHDMLGFRAVSHHSLHLVWSKPAPPTPRPIPPPHLPRGTAE
jgi:hypothetical protein